MAFGFKSKGTDLMGRSDMMRNRQGRSGPLDLDLRVPIKRGGGPELAQRTREVMAFRFRSKGYDLTCAGEVWCA